MRITTVMAAALSLGSLLSGQVSAEIVGGGTTAALNLYNVASVLPRLLPDDFNYIGVGSGAGKTAFLTNSPALIYQPSGTPVDFAGSESVLTATELANYNAANGRAFGKLIQIPVAGMPITIPYKRAGVTNLQLSAAQLCDVFSGSVSTWGQLLGTYDTTPIKVIYRSDSAGTTEMLSRFLNDSCPTQFSVNSNFTVANIGAEPSNWQGVRTSADMIAAVNANDGSIGYDGPGYVKTTDNSVVARVSKTAMAPGTAPLPTGANTRTALGTAVAPATAADRADPLKWVPTFGRVSDTVSNVPTAAGAYPIVGYTNFLVGQCYANAADATAIRNFFNDLYTGAKITTIAVNIFVALPTPFAAEIKKSFLDNGYNQGLDIANASVCNGIGRP
jgi:ABC-type phosphate transport system substrate-binding protein